MPVRLVLSAVLLASLMAGCSASSQPSTPPTSSKTATPSLTRRSSPSPSPPLSSSLTPAASSAALGRFSEAQATTALAIARLLGTESVSDPDLLAHAKPHTSIADYGRLTRYLTPSAIRYLATYAHDAYKNTQHSINISGLALVAYSASKTPGTNSKAHKVIPTFNSPFKPSSVIVTVNPVVSLDSSGRMAVTEFVKAAEASGSYAAAVVASGC